MIPNKLPARALSTIGLALLLAACKPAEEPKATAIVGAVLFDGTGGPPISDSVVTVEGSHIRAAGSRANLPVPDDADKIDGSGKFLAPALIDLQPSAGGARPLAGFANISSLAEARSAVENGATGLLGMIRDTGTIDPVFIARLRDLRIVVAPKLRQTRPAELALAKRNTKLLAEGGVPIAVASGGDIYREMELLGEAGLSPSEVLLAATRNGALALGEFDRSGSLEPGKRADLLLLSRNPAEDAGNLRSVARAMRDGQWIGRP